MGLSWTAWEVEEPAKVRKGSLSSDPKPSAVSCAMDSTTAIGVPICFVVCCPRCRLLLFLTVYICSSEQLDKCLFVSLMLSSLLFTLQIELHIGRHSGEVLLKNKQSYPKQHDHSYSHWIRLEVKPWNTEDVGEVKPILPAREKNNSQLDSISSLSLKIMANWLRWMVTDSKRKEWGIDVKFR